MFKPVGSFALIAFFVFVFSASAGTQATAPRMAPAASTARPAAALAKSVDCRAPATVGEDYQGLACAASVADPPVLFAPWYSVGEDFSGP